LCDIDHFKQVNDSHGHLVGDEVLRQVSSRLSSCTRSGDLVGRYGGEEFLILLKDHEVNRAPHLGQLPFGGEPFLHRAEQIRQAVRISSFATEAGPLPVSVSIGAVTIVPSIATVSMELLLSRADQALYRAKAAGRDRAVFAEPFDISVLEEKPCSGLLSPVV
jgi:diguanylate cyclase (GGDEF)-like protein